jgi:hypothetical protein
MKYIPQNIGVLPMFVASQKTSLMRGPHFYNPGKYFAL